MTTIDPIIAVLGIIFIVGLVMQFFVKQIERPPKAKVRRVPMLQPVDPNFVYRGSHVKDQQLPMLRPVDPNNPGRGQILIPAMERGLADLDQSRRIAGIATQHAVAKKGMEHWILPDDVFDRVIKEKYGKDPSRMASYFARPGSGAEIDPNWNPQKIGISYARASKFDISNFHEGIGQLVWVTEQEATEQEGAAALGALVYQDWANKNLARPPGSSNAYIKFVDDATEEKARQYANEKAKQIMADPNFRRLDGETMGKRMFERHVREASTLVPNWVKANPHDPLAQRVVAEMLEVQNDTSLSEKERQDKMARILVGARNELWQRNIKFAPPMIEPPQPPKRNRMPGGEDPVF
jgi:hypothetical protein